MTGFFPHPLDIRGQMTAPAMPSPYDEPTPLTHQPSPIGCTVHHTPPCGDDVRLVRTGHVLCFLQVLSGS